MRQHPYVIGQRPVTHPGGRLYHHCLQSTARGYELVRGARGEHDRGSGDAFQIQPCERFKQAGENSRTQYACTCVPCTGALRIRAAFSIAQIRAAINRPFRDCGCDRIVSLRHIVPLAISTRR